MARNSRSMYFDFFGRDKSLSKTMGRAGRDADSLGRKFKRVSGGITRGMGLATVSVAGLSVALGKFASDSVKAASESQVAQSRLADAFAQFPALAGANVEALQKFNSALEFKVAVDDDVIASGQTVLASFKLTAGQIQQLTPLMVDYAKRTGKDMPTAARDLGKALLGSGKALKGLGVNFKDTGSLGGNFKQLIAGLSSTVGGFAANELTTGAGKLELIKTQFGEFQEQIGNALLPGLSDLADAISQNVMPRLGEFGAWFSTTVGAITGVVDWVIQFSDVLLPAAAAVGGLTVAMWILDAAMAANPVGAVILGLELLIALGALVVINFQSIFTSVYDMTRGLVISVGTIGTGIGDFVSGIANQVIGLINGVIQAWNGLSALWGATPVSLVPQVDFGAFARTVTSVVKNNSGAQIWAASGFGGGSEKKGKPAAPKVTKSFPAYNPGAAGMPAGKGGLGGVASRGSVAKKKKRKKKKPSVKAMFTAAQVGLAPGTRHSIDGAQMYMSAPQVAPVIVNIKGAVVGDKNDIAQFMVKTIDDARRRAVVPKRRERP